MSRHFWRAYGRERQSGLTLIELLVTIIIAGIAFVAIVPVVVQAVQAGQGDRARALALSVAQDRVEKIRQLDYDLITAGNLGRTSNTTHWLYSAEFGPTATTAGRDYAVAYAVEELIDDGGKKLYKRVTVAVTWGDPASQPDIDGAQGVTLR
ncbi:MAG TPA: prepilin-type N-terminal cleavage/methylation domain-containing protein, partial [Thermoleophilia bacterium]|nr:prepilin-type N-terminal cleavage/methylation domain-containing protein [Thermoleophilia bacterium]